MTFAKLDYRKGVRALTALSAASIVLAACGGGGSASGADADGSVTLKLGHTLEADHPIVRCGVDVFSEKVSELSGGSVEIKSYPAAQVGDEQEMADSVIAGDLDITQPSAGHLAEYHAPLSVLNAAFLFDDYTQLMDTARNESGQALWDGLRDAVDVETVGIWAQGIRVVSTQDVEVRTPEDLKGVKMRAADSPIWIANITALGASATPMALGEVYTGLQQGVVDAQENPVPTIASNKYNEVQNVISLTDHVVQGNPIIINGAKWDSLTEEQRQAILDAAEESEQSLLECLETEAEEILDEWRNDPGMTVVEDVNREAFREHAREYLVEKYDHEWQGAYDDIRSSLDQ